MLMTKFYAIELQLHCKLFEKHYIAIIRYREMENCLITLMDQMKIAVTGFVMSIVQGTKT